LNQEVSVMSNPSLSSRARNTPASPIRKLAPLADAAKAKGVHVYHLNIGQPDLESPPEFIEGLKSLDTSIIPYEPSQGAAGLRKAWSAFINSTAGLNTNPEQFIITVGASEALIFAFMTCCDAGDEIVVFEPTYANYLGFAATAGMTLVPVRCQLKDNFAQPPLEEIVEKINTKTTAILFCNPNNPTGAVYGHEEVQMLLELCTKRNIFFIVDETYRELVYHGQDPLSVLQLEPDNNCVVVIDSLSKRFNLCGARIGTLLSPNEDFLKKVLRQAQARLSAPSIEQNVAAYMLENISADYVEKVRLEYRNRCNTLFEALQEIPDIQAHKPQGAFYSVVSLPVEDAEDFAKFLLSDFSYENSTVFLAPANGFYLEDGAGIDEVRIACVLNEEDLRKAIKVLGEGLKQYRETHTTKSNI